MQVGGSEQVLCPEVDGDPLIQHREGKDWEQLGLRGNLPYNKLRSIQRAEEVELCDTNTIPIQSSTS